MGKVLDSITDDVRKFIEKQHLFFVATKRPRYPATHSCHTTAMAAVLADLFPLEADALLAEADEAGKSRIWGGIHFRSDIVTGNVLGFDVANAVLEQGTPQ